MGGYRARFEDPAGQRHPLPTFPVFGHAPAHLATRRQLRAVGLAPGGQPPAGQVMWRSRLTPTGAPGDVFALLYDLNACVPKRRPSPAQLAAIGKALAARKTCPTCGVEQDYCIPRSLGECLDCVPAGALA